MKRLLLMLFVLSQVAFAQQINPNQVNWATPITSPVTFGNAVNAPMINAVQIVGLGSNTTIQAAITAAGTTGAVIIPPTYAGADTFTNSNRIPIVDERLKAFNPRGFVNSADFGTRADFNQGYGGAIIASSTTFTNSTPIFAATDVGKTVAINGAGTAGGQLLTTISGFTSATRVTLTASASTTVVSGGYFAFGTDNTAAFNTMTQASAPLGSFIQYMRVPTGNYLITGTIYVRAGEAFVGDDQGPTQLTSVNVGPTYYMMKLGSNSSGSADPVGPPITIRGIQFISPVGTQGAIDLNYAGWNIFNCWFNNNNVAINLESGSTTGLVAQNTFDFNPQIGIVMNGNAAISVIGNDFFHTTVGGIDFFSTTDVTILGNYFVQMEPGFSIYSDHASTTSSRISITGNNFVGSHGTTGYVAGISGAVDIAFGLNGSAVKNSVISGNTFFQSRAHSISINGSSSNGNITISNNIFDHTGLDTVLSTFTFQTIYDPGGSPLVISNNQFLNSGSYAFTTGVNTIATGNSCTNAFYLSGVPLGPSQGCFDFEGSGNNQFLITNNWTPDTTHYAVDISAPSSTTAISAGNLSADAGGDVIASNATVSSYSERLTVSGSITSKPANFPTGVIIPSLHSLTGTRYVCVDKDGNLVSSADACNGT